MVMVGTSADDCWALSMVGPAARFRTRAEATAIRKGRLRDIKPPPVHRKQEITRNVSRFQPFGKPSLVSVRALLTPEPSSTFNLIRKQHLPDVWALPTIEVQFKIL